MKTPIPTGLARLDFIAVKFDGAPALVASVRRIHGTRLRVRPLGGHASLTFDTSNVIAIGAIRVPTWETYLAIADAQQVAKPWSLVGDLPGQWLAGGEGAWS